MGIEDKEEFFKFHASVETLDAINTFDISSISLTSTRCFSEVFIFAAQLKILKKVRIPRFLLVVLIISCPAISIGS